MVLIQMNNNKVKLDGDMKIINKIYKALSIKHPKAFHIRSYMQPGWDGYFHYLTENCYAKTGMYPRIVGMLEEWGVEYEVEDLRTPLEFKGLPKKIGDHIPRENQLSSISSVVDNVVGGVPFRRGIINAATNAGKTTIAAGIYLSFDKEPTILLLNDGDLFEQFRAELPKLVGNDIGFVRGKESNFANFTVAMVPTLYSRKESITRHLEKFKIVLVDECDLATSKSYKYCLERTHNAVVKVGLSGSALTHKDKLKNMTLIAYFGEELKVITKKELVELGISTRPVIKIIMGGNGKKIPGDYPREYREGIIFNDVRNKQILKRIHFNLGSGRMPLVVVAKFKDHTEHIYKLIKEEFPELSVEYIHSGVPTKTRTRALSLFKEGKLDVLVSSLIIRRGKNLPLIQTILNIAAVDNEQDINQIMGRGERTHGSKNKFYMEDFFDTGKYLLRHSKHRIRFYKKQGFKVIEVYKKKN